MGGRILKKDVLDHGYVKLLNLSGPVPREDEFFDADDTDFANVARISFDQQDLERSREDDLKLANYLIRNRHTTPIEMVVGWWEMKMPLFVARQFVRHRTVSINEMSARYTEMLDEYYIPEAEVVGQQSGDNKQGRDITGPVQPVAHSFRAMLSLNGRQSHRRYLAAIKSGVPRELARCMLPVNIYTKWVWKQDIWNTMNFLRLRLDSHAQYEARMYAEAMHGLLSENLPETMHMFDEHIMGIKPEETPTPPADSDGNIQKGL